MRKASVIPAALLAAGFVLGVPSLAEAKGARHRHTQTVSKDGGSGPAAKQSGHTKKRTAHARRSAAKAPVKARRHARGNRQVGVVLDRVELEIPQSYGPFAPTGAYDFPRPPCGALDVVVEAHVHESDEETPEAPNVADSVPPVRVGPLTRVARTLGSFLRPKSSLTTLRPEDVDLSDLMTAGVQIPVEGVDASRLRDSFLSSRGKHAQHLAIDIGAPKGTPVIAAADGEIVRLSREKRGGIALYQKDSTGRYLLFYCHLTGYAEGLQSGQKVSRGDVIGYVGRTGHVIGGPHLHFSITRLPEDDDNFKAGVAINPYLLFLAAVP